MTDSASSLKPVASTPLATVIYGAWNQALPVVGKTIREVKRELGADEDWNVPKDAKGYDGKLALDDDHKIVAGQTITFSKKMGEKG